MIRSRLELNKISNLPEKPGCYLFLDEAGNIIYIGKAKNLKKRVSSYFSSQKKDAKTEALKNHIKRVDFIVTDNEMEALILENSIIKKNQPKYNINLKDAKNFAYIKISEEKFPTISTTRKKNKHGDFFGPFVSGENRNILLQMTKKIFRIRSCKKMPKKPCIRFQINLCSAPCSGEINEEEYSRQVRHAKLFLSGKTGPLLKGLKKEMKDAASEENYELALELRKKIEAVEFLNEKQKMSRSKTYNEDLINFINRNGNVYLMLFNIYKGILENKREWIFEEKDSVIDEFLVRFYSENPVPKELIMPVLPDPAVTAYLMKMRGSGVKITIPKKGEKRDLLDFVKRNIEISNFGDMEKLERLQEILDLNEFPSVIECFDISHLSGTHTVGSMVNFVNGIPDKSNYRRFLIKSFKGVDDFSGIREVVLRRYRRLKNEHKSFPDLVVIDGGASQLSAALASMNLLDVKIPVISLAKREEEVYIPGKPVPLRPGTKDKGLQLLMKIRDEAHRFAIKYNRLLRTREIKRGKNPKTPA